MRGSNVIEDYNSYHGIQTVYGSTGMPKVECDKCEQRKECAKAAPWIKLCEKQGEAKRD